MLFLGSIVWQALSASASATSSSTANVEKRQEDIVGFVKGDNQRDTLSLLISCFATLGLCVYSAVHLNVPMKRETYFQNLWRQIKWCVIGLFAPELVLYTAWRQFASAKQLCDEVKQVAVEQGKGGGGSGEEKESSKDEKIASTTTGDSAPTLSGHKNSFTLAHGFYATMGGIAIELDPDNPTHAGIFGTTTRLTVTAKGAALLAQCNLLPDISIDDIKDKNKTDSLAKLLVCIQAGWMVIQVIYRTAQHFPTSLLEVHTVAHVVCALVTYGVWWHKPRQVAFPTRLRGDDMLPLATYMYMASRMSGTRSDGFLGRILHPKPALKHVGYVDERVSNASTSSSTDGDKISSSSSTPPPNEPRGRFISLPKENNNNSNTPSKNQHPDPTTPLPPPSSSSTPDDANPLTHERTHLALRAIALYPTALLPKFKPPKPSKPHKSQKGVSSSLPPPPKPPPAEPATPPYLHPYSTELLQPTTPNWPNAGLLRRTQSLIMGMTLWGASLLYGSIHIAAWRYFFPTPSEQLLWRLSSVWVTFCAAFWLWVHVLAFFFPGIDRLWVAYNERRLGWAGMAGISALCVLCGVAFVASRAFLVVESFVGIRRVPRGVYEVPSWSEVFPHL